MESVRSFIKKGNKVNQTHLWGDAGDYFFVLCTGSNEVTVINKNNCTAGNYLGAGSWTVNPVHATISLTAATWGAIVYCPLYNIIACFATARCIIIDADPTSASFATILTNNTYSTTTVLGGAAWSPFMNTFILRGNVLYTYDHIKNILTSFTTRRLTQESLSGVVGCLIADPVRNEMHASYANNVNNGKLVFCPVMPKVKTINGAQYLYLPSYITDNNLSFASSSANNTSTSVVETINEDTREILSSVAITGVNIANVIPYSYSQKKLFVTNPATLITYFIDASNPYALGTPTSHTRTGVGTENKGWTSILSGDGTVLLVYPGGTGALTHVHVYDAVSNSYVGYINTGTLYNAAVNKNLVAINRMKHY